MNIINAFRNELQAVPFLNDWIDAMIARTNAVFGAQHNDADGTHTNVTATSLTTTGAIVGGSTGTFDGDVIAQADGTNEQVQIGALTGDPDGNIGPAQRFGSATSGWLVRVLPGGALSPFTGSKGEYAIYDYAKSTVQPILRLGCIGTDPALLGGGTLYLGDSAKEITGLYAKDAYLSNGVHERNRTAAMGEWTAFTPTRTAATGTWTGGTITTAQYTLIGKTMTVLLQIEASTNSAGTGSLSVTIPGGFIANKEIRNYVVLNDGAGATFAHGQIIVAAGGTTVVIMRSDGANFAANAGTLYVRGQITFEVQ